MRGALRTLALLYRADPDVVATFVQSLSSLFGVDATIRRREASQWECSILSSSTANVPWSAPMGIRSCWTTLGLIVNPIINQPQRAAGILSGSLQKVTIDQV